MEKWMNEWLIFVVEWKTERLNEWMNDWLTELINKWMNELTNMGGEKNEKSTNHETDQPANIT